MSFTRIDGRPLDVLSDYLATKNISYGDVLAILLRTLDEARKLRGDVDRLRDRVEALERAKDT